MTTTDIKTERFAEQTVFSFTVLSERNNAGLRFPNVSVTKYDDNDFLVCSDDFHKDFEKSFNNEDDADLYAMKKIFAYKKSY